jgi:hypothetical protein
MITDNFPLQKWVYIIISVDNQYVDAYLDGKLIQSHRFYIPQTSAMGSTAAAPPIIPKIPPPCAAPTVIPLPGVTPQTSIYMYLGNSDTANPYTYQMTVVVGSTPGTSTVKPVTFQGFDAYVSKFKRWDSGPVDPQTAWSAYMEGNGTNPILGALGNYGASISVLKNNVENSKLVLF